MTPQINTDRIAELRSEIEAFSSRFHDQHGKNYWWSHVLAITLILAGFFVAAAGFLGHAKVAGFLGLVVGALQAISQRFNLEEKADFLLIIASSADELIRRLRFDDLTADEFKVVLAEYNTLHSNAVGRFPKGTGIGKALETFRAATGKSVNGGGISERPAEQNPRT